MLRLRKTKLADVIIVQMVNDRKRFLYMINDSKRFLLLNDDVSKISTKDIFKELIFFGNIDLLKKFIRDDMKFEVVDD